MGSGIAALVSALLAITPTNGGLLTPTRVTINDSAGDQFDPHVDGDLAAYSNNNSADQIRYYRFSTAVDSAIPAPVGAIDLLSDVDNGRIVFTRVTDKNAIMLFDVATNTVTELAPAPNSNRYGVALGGQTAAFIDYGGNPNAGELVVLDLSTNTALTLTNDAVFDQNPAVAPGGTFVTWEACTSGSACDIYGATKVGSGWVVAPVTTHALRDTAPDTNGSQVVFQRDDPANVGNADLVLVPVGGGAETVLELPGAQFNPSIRGSLVAFEGRAAGEYRSDIFVVELTSNRVFQITATADINESLNDVTVLPNGDVRLVWQANELNNPTVSDIFGATFTLPPPTNTCTPRTVTLEAWRTYSPSRWFDDEEQLSPALTFTIPSELQVIAGNAGNKQAYLSFVVGSDTVTCRYDGGSSKAHPRTAAELAAASRYVFRSCQLDGHSHGGCNGSDDDAHAQSGSAMSWSAGTSVTASRVRLHVHNGDSWQPETRVRLTIGQTCPAPAPNPTQPPAPPPAAPPTPQGGCSSTSGSLLPVLAMLTFVLLMTRRPAAIRVVSRRERNKLPR